ncbi:MAG: peptidylprolyl isomerase [Candidatus ainarchaeum sp.]|nr:peptidylprolyl isomerase [Candidatus ainarchaeum sp.]
MVDKKLYLSGFLVLILIIAIVFLVFSVAKPKEKEITKEIAVFETTQGTFEIELDRNAAPITVENFVNYVKAGFYDGTVFHRVIPNFVAQAGGYTADGVSKPRGSPIFLESKNGLSNKLGTVAMARTMVENSATSEFYVNLKDNLFLDYSPETAGYAVFGKVIKGMDIIFKIAELPTKTKYNMEDWPVQDVVITKAYMK